MGKIEESWALVTFESADETPALIKDLWVNTLQHHDIVENPV